MKSWMWFWKLKKKLRFQTFLYRTRNGTRMIIKNQSYKINNSKFQKEIQLFIELSFLFQRIPEHRVIILNRGSMFAFQWREFSPLLSSAHRLLQCYHRQQRDRRRCNSRGIPLQPPTTMVISQWARSLEWRQAVMLHILVEKICITFFPFSCEACSLFLVLWLCDPELPLDVNSFWRRKF